jgi:hypothetical protein
MFNKYDSGWCQPLPSALNPPVPLKKQVNVPGANDPRPETRPVPAMLGGEAELAPPRYPRESGGGW